MKTYKLTEKDKDLIGIARDVIRKNYRRERSFHSTVGAALITSKGTIYYGVNIQSQTSTPTSIDAEMAAVAQMVSNGERKIDTIVAVYKGKLGYRVFQPCGACRHIISQFGKDTFVIVSKDKKARLKDLYPLPVK